jgi:hypothetical protein
MREPSWRTCLPRSTVHQHRNLTQSLRFRCNIFDGSPIF